MKITYENKLSAQELYPKEKQLVISHNGCRYKKLGKSYRELSKTDFFIRVLKITGYIALTAFSCFFALCLIPVGKRIKVLTKEIRRKKEKIIHYALNNQSNATKPSSSLITSVINNSDSAKDPLKKIEEPSKQEQPVYSKQSSDLPTEKIGSASQSTDATLLNNDFLNNDLKKVEEPRRQEPPAHEKIANDSPLAHSSPFIVVKKDLKESEMQSEQLINAGYAFDLVSKDYLNRDSMFVEKREIDNLEFGINVTRKIIVESLKKGFKGRFHTEAGYSSHVFHLYIGMIPELQARERSYSAHEFISALLNILEANPRELHPNTSELGSVKMVLSEEGLKRWTEAIENKKPFRPFENLEHLRFLMNPNELQQLDRIMAIRASQSTEAPLPPPKIDLIKAKEHKKQEKPIYLVNSIYRLVEKLDGGIQATYVPSPSKNDLKWNEEQSEQLAIKGGESSYGPSQDLLNRKSFSISKIVSYQGQAGFGTAIMRKMIAESLKTQCNGRVHTTAADSSHLFYLYMGMIPLDRSVNFVQVKWGLLGVSTIKKFPAIKEKIEKKLPLSDSEKSSLDLIREMLRTVKKTEKEKMTDQDIVNEENFQELQKLKEKEVSYFRHEFMRFIIKTLKNNPTERQPNTRALSTVEMVLSEEGLKRWRKAIHNHEPFEQFKRFEHLIDFMDPDQYEQLMSIMDLREKHQKK